MHPINTIYVKKIFCCGGTSSIIQYSCNASSFPITPYNFFTEYSVITIIEKYIYAVIPFTDSTLHQYELLQDHHGLILCHLHLSTSFQLVYSITTLLTLQGFFNTITNQSIYLNSFSLTE